MTDFDKEAARIWKSLKRMDSSPAMTLAELRELLRARRWRETLLWHCAFCGAVLALTALSLDHALPRSLGGETKPENLLESCRRCNQVKGAVGQREFHDLCNLIGRWPERMRADVVRRLGQKPSFRWRKEKAATEWAGVVARNEAAFGRGGGR